MVLESLAWLPAGAITTIRLSIMECRQRNVEPPPGAGSKERVQESERKAKRERDRERGR